MSDGKKQWGGRFAKATDKFVERYTSSLSVDIRLWRDDIRLSQAHARMLGATHVITQAESELIVAGLKQVEIELNEELRNLDGAGLSAASLKWISEDIHSEIEARLSKAIGSVSGKLHTARSRNDQVATGFRMYLRRGVDDLNVAIKGVQSWICDSARAHMNSILPGLTHTQHAQPVSLAHHLLAYFWMLDRDRQRLKQLRTRINIMPLGAAALAGTGFPIDREMVAKELQFDGVCENSLDAVSDRDFVIELCADISLLMTHLSRWCEELILWSTPEFGFMTLDDSVTTGSSIMPQKKNPDVAELIRGRTGRSFGSLISMLTMMKGLPLAYHRDLQEDKQACFDSLDLALDSLHALHLMLSSAEFHTDKMRIAVKGDFSNATDLADWLVTKGLSFREAHEVVGRAVQFCLTKGISLDELSLIELKGFSERIDADAMSKLVPESVLVARSSRGGTAPQAVNQQLERAIAALSS